MGIQIVALVDLWQIFQSVYSKVSLAGQQRSEVDESAQDELFCLASSGGSRDAPLGAQVCRYQPQLLL